MRLKQLMLCLSIVLFAIGDVYANEDEMEGTTFSEEEYDSSESGEESYEYIEYDYENETETVIENEGVDEEELSE